MGYVYTPRINPGGNFCGHDPFKPKLVLAKPAKKGKSGQPRIITLLMERMTAYYYRPSTLPSLNLANGSTRQMRSERREACIVVLASLLKNMDLASLRVGQPTKSGFLNYTLPWLAKHTALPIWRIDRAVKDLKAAKLLSVSQARQLQDDGTWKGLAAVKAISKHLFGVFGLHKMLQYEQKKAVKRLKQKARTWSENDDKKRTLSDISKYALVIGGLKTNPIQRNKRRLNRQPPSDDPPRRIDHSANIDSRMESIKANILSNQAKKA